MDMGIVDATVLRFTLEPPPAPTFGSGLIRDASVREKNKEEKHQLRETVNHKERRQFQH
jgi:hypothetical protein